MSTDRTTRRLGVNGSDVLNVTAIAGVAYAAFAATRTWMHVGAIVAGVAGAYLVRWLDRRSRAEQQNTD